MDMELPCRGDSKDQIREKLIAISECMPDKDPAASDSTPPLDVPEVANGTVKNQDATEKFMSDLISLSYEESLDDIFTKPKQEARPTGKP